MSNLIQKSLYYIYVLCGLKMFNRKRDKYDSSCTKIETVCRICEQPVYSLDSAADICIRYNRNNIANINSNKQVGVDEDYVEDRKNFVEAF